MIKAIYVDDEQYNHVLLEKLMEEIEEIKLVKSFDNALNVIEECRKIRPQVAFIDIEMPGINGLELAEKLQEEFEDICIIFVTAFSKYALDAFKVNAIDYLMKPVDETEFARVVNKIMKRFQQEKQGQRLICLGNMGMEFGGDFREFQWITKKVQELYAYLLYHHDKYIDKWVLCELLWPDSNPDKMLSNLYTTIHRLKTTIQNEDMPVSITSATGNYKLTTNGWAVDFDVFEKEGGKLLDSMEMTIEDLLAIEKMYGGELYRGEDYLWALEKRENLEHVYVKILFKIAEWFASHDIEKSIAYYKQIVSVRIYEEAAVLQIIKLYNKQKNPHQLEKFWKEYRHCLRKEMDSEPSEELLREMNLGDRRQNP